MTYLQPIPAQANGNFNTRGTSKFDLILTNLAHFYDQPLSSPPLGLSDHLTVVALAKQIIHSDESKKFIFVTKGPAASIVLEDFYVKYHGIL